MCENPRRCVSMSRTVPQTLIFTLAGDKAPEEMTDSVCRSGKVLEPESQCDQRNPSSVTYCKYLSTVKKCAVFNRHKLLVIKLTFLLTKIWSLRSAWATSSSKPAYTTLARYILKQKSKRCSLLLSFVPIIEVGFSDRALSSHTDQVVFQLSMQLRTTWLWMRLSSCFPS